MKGLIKRLFSNENNAIVIKNFLFSFLVKGGSVVITLLSTPAFIRYFNNDLVLGVWYTLLSVLIWFLNFDFGIGNGIRNNLTKALVKEDYDDAKRIISSGFFSSAVVTVVLFIIGLAFISVLDLQWIFNVDLELISYKTLQWSVIFVFIAIMIRFLLTSVSAVFYAMQKSAVNSLLSLIISVLQLIFVLIFKFDEPETGILVLSISYIFTSTVPIIVAAIIVFGTRMKKCRPNIKYIDKEHINKVLGIGAVFFSCQILYMLIMNTNEFLITNIFGPQYTTAYTFYHKISNLFGTMLSLAMTPLWSVITKALAENDYIWLKKLYKTIKLSGLGLVVCQFVLVPFMPFIMDIWLGKGTLTVNTYISISFACLGATFIYGSILSTIVCGMAKMKLQSICYAIGTILKFAIVILGSKFFQHWTVVVWANSIVLLIYCIAEQISLERYFKKISFLK